MSSAVKFHALFSPLKAVFLSGLMVVGLGSSSVLSQSASSFDNLSILRCGDIIGRVFDDKDGDGYHDEGERGLAGVRLATVSGQLITTDHYGRYHYACDRGYNERTGSNFILKLDTRTLPTGYRVTSENPRVVRLTSGKVSKLNFGVARMRVVSMNLNNQAFKRGSTARKRHLDRALGTLIDQLSKGRSVLKVTYQENSGDRKLSRKRLREVTRVVKRKWRRAGSPYNLEIDSKIILR